MVLSAAVAASAGQIVDEKDAKILKEQRFNAGDGRAGSAFATENEIIFREESDASGNRIGQYSYIGEDGQSYTVKYSAGKDGFRILDGSHIPSTGQDAAPFAPEIVEESAPAIPVLKQAVVRPATEAPAFLDYDDQPADPNFNPFINPHDPTHRNFAFNKNGAKFAPKVPGVLGSHNVPNCAGCEGLNPFVNPFDASHQQAQGAGLLPGHLAGAQAATPPRRVVNAQPTGRVVAAKRPTTLQFNPAATTPTPPKRFFPPGQLKLNRFETGFNFDFES